MNYDKIGALIAKRRKAAGMTQEALAGRLGVSAKAVSKWENSVCLPDVSLYEPLCGQLGISIGELFAGQELKNEDSSAAKDWLINLLAGQIYPKDCGISFEEFRNALLRMAETTVLLSSFASKEEAVAYFVEETGLPHQDCEDAYLFYTRRFQQHL